MRTKTTLTRIMKRAKVTPPMWLILPLLLLLVWSSVPLFVRKAGTDAAGREALSGIDMVFWVTVFSIPILLIWLLPGPWRRTIPVAPGGIRALRIYIRHSPIRDKLVTIGLLSNYAYQVGYFTGVSLADSASVFIVSAAAVSNTVAIWLIYRARETPLKPVHWALLIAAIVGGTFPAVRDGVAGTLTETGVWALGLALLTGLCASIGDARTNLEANARQYDASVMVLIAKVATLAVAGIAYVSIHGGVPVPTTQQLFLPALIGTVADGVGFVMYAMLISLRTANNVLLRAKIVLLAGPFVQTLLLWLGGRSAFIPEEPLSPFSLLPILLVIIPIMVLTAMEGRGEQFAQTRDEA